MAEVGLYFDERYVRKNGTCAVKIRVGERNRYMYISTGVSVYAANWNGRSVHGCPEAAVMNTKINAVYVKVLAAVNRLEMDGSFSLRALKAALKGGGEDYTLFTVYYEKAMAHRRGRTKQLYGVTLAKMRMFDGTIDRKFFCDINRDWLVRFDEWMVRRGNAVNTRSIDMRNIRAVFNEAINEEVAKEYPFRRFTIKKEQTRMRNLTVERLRDLRDRHLAGTQAMYRDLFMLSFYLCGINAVDLLTLKSLTNGRVVYRRRKTGRMYDVPVCCEALAIINRYKGEKHLLCPLDSYKDYHIFLQHWNDGLQRIEGFPDITTYYARYTFASVAAELDIPRDTIALCLGHSWADVTATYINYDVRKKVDKAVQQVVEYVRGEKIEEEK